MSLHRVTYNGRPAWIWKSKNLSGKPFIYTPGDIQSETRAKQLAKKDGERRERVYGQED